MFSCISVFHGSFTGLSCMSSGFLMAILMLLRVCFRRSVPGRCTRSLYVSEIDSFHGVGPVASKATWLPLLCATTLLDTLVLLFSPPFRCSRSTVLARYAVLFLLSYRNSVFSSWMASVVSVGVLSVAAQKDATGSPFVDATPFPPLNRSPRTQPNCRTIWYAA